MRVPGLCGIQGNEKSDLEAYQMQPPPRHTNSQHTKI